MVEPDAQVFGLKPWFPWPLSRWRWLTEPVRAERLAALRVGIALVMFLDVLFTLFWDRNTWFGPESLGDPRMFSYRFKPSEPFELRFRIQLNKGIINFGTIELQSQRWSLLHDRDYAEKKIDTPEYRSSVRSRTNLVLGLWVLSSFLLLIGCLSRVNAVFCWAMSVSLAASNSYIDNAGDTVRTLTLFYLMLAPCGKAWAIDAWLRRRFHWSAVRGESGEFRGIALMRRETPAKEPYYVHPWALRLLFVQMMVIYLFNGLYKGAGDTWHEGRSLYNVLGDLTLSRFSYAMFPVPYWMTQIATWMVLWWEILFAPMMMVPWHSLADLWKKVGPGDFLIRYTREIFLVFGALFHLGIVITMEIGGFGLYMLCLYLPLVPWELLGRKKPTPEPSTSS